MLTLIKCCIYCQSTCISKMLLILLLFAQGVLSSGSPGWNCYEYALGYPETDATIPLAQRRQYLSKLCGTVKACHAHPQLYSYDIYVDDVIRCYEMRLYNFDKTIFERYRSGIGGYITARQMLEQSNLNYDVLNLKGRDTMESIVNSVRLRDAYLREFRYTALPPLTGDVFLLLSNSRSTFIVESRRQQNALETMVFSTVEQLSEAQLIKTKLDSAYALILNHTVDEAAKRLEFEEAEIKIQENVIGSLLEIEEIGY